MAKIVLFVDALEPTETHGTRFKETERGLMDSGAPKVTPAVTSQVYTGMSPSQTGFGAQHSMKGERPHRPQAPTIMEKLEAAGYNVASLHMPYCHPLQLQNGAFVSDTMQGPQPGPNPLAQMCMQPPTVGDLMDPEDDGSFAYNARMQDINAKSSSMLNAIAAGGFDVVFLGIRSPDQYTHFQWHEPYRVELLKDIAFQVEQWEQNHEVLWWSDHGSEEKKETFRVNKWLMDEGLLDLDIDVEFHDRFSEEMASKNPQQAQRGEKVENQMAVHSPGVEIQEGSVAVSADPYDSSIDLLDDEADPYAVAKELESTGMYDRVVPTEEEWGEGPHMDVCPDIVALRADHVLVTGNVHPDPIGMGFLRTGVHSKYGAWGTTDESFEADGTVTPRGFHDVIWQFVTGENPGEASIEQEMDRLQQQFDAALGAGD